MAGKSTQTVPAGGPSDPSDHLLDTRKLGLYFLHVATGVTATFKAFLTAYSDDFSSEWASESVYGRMDPIHTFQGTKRSISLAWDVPSISYEEAEKNFKNAQSMYSMLYPAYRPETATAAGIIASPPLIKLKFGNLIYDASASAYGGDVKTTGLLGWLADLSFAPDLEAGFFDEKPGFLIPQTIKLNCTFNVLHQHPLGWNSANQGKLRKKSQNFPYSSDVSGAKAKSPPPVEADIVEPSPIEPSRTNVVESDPDETPEEKAKRKRNAELVLNAEEKGVAATNATLNPP